MLAKWFYRGGTMLLLCVVISCSRHQMSKLKKVPLVPVKGSVSLDGNPQSGIKVKCIPLSDFEPKEYIKSLLGMTNDKGEFILGTYEPGDGLPPGKYALTFVWEPFPVGMRIGGNNQRPEDQLQGRYSSLENSPLTIDVEEDSPLEIDPILLKSNSSELP